MHDPNEQPLSLMQRSGFLDSIGTDSVYDSLEDALVAITASRARPEPVPA